VTAAAPVLEVFENPQPRRGYEIVHAHHEFTSLCPLTGHPDFAVLTVRYVPDRTCVELKSLKQYLHGYRQQGVFFEALVNRILDDLVAVLEPRRIEVKGEFRGRGGITSTVTARHPEGAWPNEVR
jgi:7-cyano-7-deazaguanine reductase